MIVDTQLLDFDALRRLRDECSRRMLMMQRTEGLHLDELLILLEEIKQVLREQGKEWHSLGDDRRWEDGQMLFNLNPVDHDLYRAGYFSIDALRAWTGDTGPIMYEEVLEEDNELVFA